MWRFAQFGTICTILKNVENTHGELLHLIKLQAKPYNSTENNTTLLHGCFIRFLNCTNGTKSRVRFNDSGFVFHDRFIFSLKTHISQIIHSQKNIVNKMVFKPANKYQIIQQCHSFQKNFLDDCRKQQLFEYL